jgi:hypothetical protein
MRWSDFEKYLKGEHLAGKKPVVTIAEVVLETTHANGREEEKPVLYFVGKQKGLILSPTNQRTLRNLFGDDVSNCRGKSVQLEAVPMRVAGRDTLPIRINPAPQPAPQPQPAPTAAATVDDLNGWNDLVKDTPAAEIKPIAFDDIAADTRAAGIKRIAFDDIAADTRADADPRAGYAPRTR